MRDSELSIELATSNDLSKIVELKLLMFEDAGLSDLLKEDIEQHILNDYKTMYKQNTAVHYIYNINGNIAAMTGAFIKSDIPYCYYKTRIYGFIGDVYTVHQHRDKGFASMLNRCALKWLQEKGVTSVRLLASPQAKSIYQRLGFENTDEMVLYFQR